MLPKGTEKCKKIPFIFLSIALSILLLSVLASAYSNETVGVGSTVVNPGVPFSLPVFIDNITNISSLSLDLIFNSSSLQIDDIDGNSSSSVSDTQFHLDNSTGFANMTLEFDDLSSEEEINVANLMFISLSSGHYDIMLHDVSFSNNTTSFPANFVVNGSVRVNYPPEIVNIENMTVDAGFNLNFTLSATDLDDDNLIFGVEGIPDGYSLNSSNGSFSWTPTATDADNNYSANFSVSDGYASDFTYATIFVNEIVDDIDNPPVIKFIGNKSLNETETLSFVVEATDADNNPISYSANALPGNSTLNETSGEFNWVTGYSDAGEYSVEFLASSTNLTDSELITIFVENLNRPPILSVINDVEINENDSLSITLSANDPDNNDLTYSSNVSFGNMSGNIFTWVPAFNEADTYVVEFTVSDGIDSDSKNTVITVNNVNRPPVLGEIGTQSVSENSLLEITLSATDDDSAGILTYSTNASFGNLTDNVFTWTPGSEESGVYAVEFNVSDGSLADSEIVTINVTNVNNAPVLEEIGEQYVHENETLTINLSATDDDSGATLSYYTNATFGNLSDNVFTWIPNYDAAGSHITEFTVSDGTDSDSEVVTINVQNTNRAPVLSPIDDVEVNENNSFSITLSASDLDGNNLNYSTNATFGNISGNDFNWTPDFDDAGTYNVEFTVSDGTDSDSEVVVIIVNNANRPPILNYIGPQSVLENNLLEISLSATDEDSEDILIYGYNTSFGELNDNVFTWTPDSENSGIYAVEFNVSDGSLVDSEIVIINVTNVNNAPVLDEIGDKDINENDTLTISLSANDDDSGDTLSYYTNATFGDLSDNIFIWTPDYDDSGVYNVEFNVSDGYLVDYELVTITVNNVNNEPILSYIGEQFVNENETLTITLSATDADADANLNYSTNATFGNMSGNTFTWSPDYDSAGIYSVEFTVDDGMDSDSETVIINIENINLAPVLSPIDDIVVNENELLSITLSANDPDGNNLNYSTNSTFGNVAGNIFTWTPDYDAEGIYVLEFTVSDGLDSDSELVTVEVNNVNRAPVLSSPGSYSAAENSSLVITLSATDPDTGDSLFYSHNATFGILEDNVFTWVPDFDHSGVHTIEFTVSDGNLSDSKVAVITVSNTNRPPYIEIIDDKLLNENEELIIDINGTDPDGDSLTYETNVDFGTLENNIFTWTPGFDDSGIYDVSFTVSDGNLSYTEDIKIAVGNTNVPPVLNPIGGKTVDENNSLSFTISATDEDSGDTLTYAASGLPSGASFNDQTRQFFWKPTYNQSGTHNVVFEVSDGTFSDTELVQIVVNNINIAPVIGSIGNMTVNENSEINFIVTATDHDKDSLVYSVSNPSQVGSFNSITHEFSWTPDYGESGVYSLTFTVDDGDLFDSATIYIEVLNVNRVPELDNIGNKAVNEAEELSFTISGSDPDSDPLVYSASGIPDGADFDESTHIFTWTPDYDDSGTYDVTFTLSDGSLTDSETITISVGSVNLPPELESIGDKTAIEGSEVSFSISAIDPDMNDLTYSTSALPQGAYFDESTLDFSWTPDYNQSGIHSITFTVSDGELTDSETIFIDVENTNRAPVMGDIGNKNVDENTTLVFKVSADDPDLDSLTYSATGVPDTADFDYLTREFTWTPNYGESGTYSVTFNVTDGALSDSETIVISVGFVNRAPDFESIGDKTISEGSELNFSISATDPDEDALAYSTSELPEGADFDEITHLFSWTPDYEQEGSYSITFTVSDGDLSDSEIISIDVQDTNRAPVLSEIGNKETAENTELSFTINAEDPDSDSLTYSADNLPNGANFDTSSHSFVWTPGYDDSGTYEVTFKTSDGELSDTETITITVGSVNRPPVLAYIGNKQINENSELVFQIAAADPDSDYLIFYIENKPTGAAFNGNTGQFRWTPDYNASGTYSVTFGVNDGSLNDSETIYITVNNVNLAPVLDNIGNKQVDEGSELSFNISAMDHDGDNLIYYATGIPQGASFDPDTHEFSWITDYDDSGTYSVTFYVSDAYRVTSKTIFISVGSVNRAPELVPIGNRTIDEGSELRFTVTGSDPEASDLTYSVTGIPDGADFDGDTHEFIWMPDYDQSGTYNVTFSVSDGELSDSETVTITVEHVNIAPVLSVIGDVYIDENQLLTISLQASDDDDDSGDTLHFSVKDAPVGSAINESTGIFTWIPSYEDAGIYDIVFSVSDGTTEDTQNVEITVININRLPQMNVSSQVYVAENSTLNLDLNASDPDNTPLSITTDFSIGSLNNGIFTWTPGYEDEGSYDATFTVSDGELEVSQTVEIIVTGSNSAPVLSPIDSIVVNELETLSINLTAKDIDDDELNFSKNVEYGELADNLFTWTPGINDKGIYYIVFTVSDGQLSDSKTAMIAVGNTNIPPTIVKTGIQYGKESETLEFTINATDPDNETLIYAVTDLPSGATFNTSTGSFEWTPTYEQSGEYSIEFRVSDLLYTAFDTVLVNVENVNRAPLFDPIPMCKVNETEQVKINLSATDPDRDTISFSTDFDNGQIIGDTFVWDTGYYDSGEYYILFNVTDNDLSSSTTVHLKVNPTNMPPEFDNIGSHSVYENETIEFSVNATDADNDTLTYSISGKPSGSSFDPKTRLFRWTPDYRQSGTYSVEFHVTDGELNDSEAITIRVYDKDNTKPTDYSGFSSSESSGSGGGGSSSGAEDYDNVAYKDYSIKYVTQGRQIEFAFPNSENDLETVGFTALKAAGQVKTVIEILHDRSTLVNTNPPGNVYRHVNIWVGDTKFNSGAYFSSAEITFKVQKQWLEENNAEPSSVKLYRYSGGSWNQLTTSRIGADAKNYYFKAYSPGFSPFAIVSTGSTQVLQNSVPEPSAQNTQVIYKSNTDLNSVTAVTDSEIMSKALENEPASPFNTRIFFIGIVGILLIGSAIGYHSRNESPVLRRYYEAIHTFVLGIKNAVEWTSHKLSSESIHEDYTALSVKLNEIRNVDYKAIYEKKIALIKERQKQ
ncbi:Ig-like domain-containing protein [Methanolobus bombayensis]|uniref:Ig-like domain-containing protein n=1 Tax=Methanolobus bombayensis TaxID=38023 RepID=UPI001AE36D82|nr:putative Ig domain-containing protein [Methanolobus bombayensis]MBP1909264.1 PGF-pre-PGF domain-containing protein [Methanolobus bombayensis]